jgi:hypothetical protein
MMKLETKNSNRNLGISIEAIPIEILYMKHDHYKESSLCGFASQNLQKSKKERYSLALQYIIPEEISNLLP